MRNYPFYMMAVMIMLMTSARVTGVTTRVDYMRQYQGLVSSMAVCHNALVQYVQANHGVTGAIPTASVDAYLPPGSADPGTFTYLVTAPGTATTYLTAPARGQIIAITVIQKLSNYSLFAGVVSGGSIVPRLPAQPVPAPGGVPDGVIAVQTIVSNH
jgi:hypothetical protein